MQRQGLSGVALCFFFSFNILSWCPGDTGEGESEGETNCEGGDGDGEGTDISSSTATSILSLGAGRRFENSGGGLGMLNIVETALSSLSLFLL